MNASRMKYNRRSCLGKQSFQIRRFLFLTIFVLHQTNSMDEITVHVNKDTIELDQFKGGEAAYDTLTEKSVNQETYDCLKEERKVKSETSKMDKVDNKKFVIILVSIVVTGLVVVVVSVTALVYVVFRGSATDGAWTNWGEWGLCSVSCGVGLITRIRTCTDPRPKMMGRYCDGFSDQVQICNNIPCSNSIWTNWGNWGSCSDTCGGGLSTRTRTCINPSFSLLGQYCNGSSEHVKICNNIPCSEPAVTKVLFCARGIKNLSPVHGETLVFETTITRVGSGYDNTTGIFTVPVSGTFMFSLQLCLRSKKYLFFEITANDRVLLASLNMDDYASYWGCYTSVVPAYLNTGERVWVRAGRGDSGSLRENANENWNMFTGVLIHT